jgi:hypothetical protein
VFAGPRNVGRRDEAGPRLPPILGALSRER